MAATFTVNRTSDGSDFTPAHGRCEIDPFRVGDQCTLRAAIEQANASAGQDTIRFSVNSGVQTIAPNSPLPAVTGSVVIDGTTQPGYGGSPPKRDRDGFSTRSRRRWGTMGRRKPMGGFAVTPLEHVAGYAPTLPELLISLGVYGVGFLILTLLYNMAIRVREEPRTL